jgi:ribonucleoside-diphosphate reductase alpha chain
VNTDEESLSSFIWRTRYRAADASPAERSVADTLERVAKSVAAIEKQPAAWSERYAGILRGFRFLPAGRILAGAGLARQSTLFNCFVGGIVEDSIPGIFEALKEGAVTMQQGGGIGYDFSTLRPRGGRARATGMIASGPVSFMRVWDAMCATVMSTGARRGAMMGTLRCDHPDILEFVDAKLDPESLRHFNISVLVTDKFMQAVEADAPWPLVFPEDHEDAGGAEFIARAWSGSLKPLECRVWKTIGARELWARLCANAQACAEPGVLYIDRINAENNLGYAEILSATNPCAEEPLPPYGACCLGSLNLAAFVTDAFTGSARLDHGAIANTARLAVRFLDDVIEIARFPLFRQRAEAHRSRRIGLGLTGLADALAMLGLRYDSDAGRAAAGEIMQTLRDAAYSASIELAEERGPFEAFRAPEYLERPFIRRLPAQIQSRLHRQGIRNSHLLAIAPAGTISLLAHNVSSGIEPIFRCEAHRRVLDSEGAYHDFRVTDYAYRCWRELKGAAGGLESPAGTLPDALLDQSQISPRDHLLMQAALQPLVDGSISKTVSLPSDAPAGSAQEIFETAYGLHLKGCTVFREAARPGVLTESQATSCERNAHCCDTERESD